MSNANFDTQYSMMNYGLKWSQQNGMTDEAEKALSFSWISLFTAKLKLRSQVLQEIYHIPEVAPTQKPVYQMDVHNSLKDRQTAKTKYDDFWKQKYCRSPFWSDIEQE